MNIQSVGNNMDLKDSQNMLESRNSKEITNLVQLSEYMNTHPEYTPTERQKMILDNVIKAEKEINRLNLSLEYDIHDATNRVMIKVVDTDTDKVIKELPPEKLLDLAAEMCKRAGVFVDEQC